MKGNMQFRKKPVVIDAVRVDDLIRNAAHSWEGLPEWIRAAYGAGDIVFTPNAVLVHTREGDMRGNLSDWIIKGVAGELYPCKPDIFAATYEAVE